jgi:SAM domain (Sterile alpha motif)
MNVADWLRVLGLERYEATFRQNDVDTEVLPKLTADDLKELGITSLGHRVSLRRSPCCASKTRQLTIPLSRQ